MAETQLFQKMLPINIKFFQGESPSPTKLNGIFNYIQASYYILESFLGNGIDYGVTVLKDRKMVFNLSSTIGQASNLYRPTNKLGSIYQIHQHFGALHTDEGSQAIYNDTLHTQHTQYTEGDGVMSEFVQILQQVNVPISYEAKDGEGHQLGIIYTGSGTINVFTGDGTSTPLACTAPTGGALKQKTLTITTDYIDYIQFTPTSNFKIYSIWLVENSEALLTDDVQFANKGEITTYNVGCAIPVDNGLAGEESFWKIASPCVHSLSTATNKCKLRTCNYCIGNTYDIFVDQTNVGTKWNASGSPICGGDVGLVDGSSVKGEIDTTLVPTDSVDAPIKYTGVQYTAASANVVYTLQSCLLMRSKPFMAKFRPFAAHERLGSELTLTRNESALYDMSANYNPIKYDITLRSAGRPDIIYVFDPKRELSAGTNNKISVIGGTYNISQMLKDILKHTNERQTPQVAVYAD